MGDLGGEGTRHLVVATHFPATPFSIPKDDGDEMLSSKCSDEDFLDDHQDAVLVWREHVAAAGPLESVYLNVVSITE